MARKPEATPNLPEPKPRRRPLTLWISLAASICVIALTLGLGLGLGLKHSSTSESLTTDRTPITWKRDPNDYVLPPTFDKQAAPTTRTFTFNLTEIQDGAPDGYIRPLLLINGKFPGPVVEANEGDRLVVTVNNQMTLPATIHWHGQYQNGTNFMDGSSSITQCPIQPNTSFTYNFTFQQYGTYWYHAHYSTIYQDGLFGPLIIHGRNETDYNVQGDFVVMVDDWYHNFSTTLLPGFFAPGNEGVEPIPDSGLLNGLNICDGSPSCDNSSADYYVSVVNPNSRYRYRIINTGAFTDFKFSVDNHVMELIEADGTELQPLNVHTFPIHVAQRYSFILEANQTSQEYWIRALMNTNCMQGSPDNPLILGILQYNNTNGLPNTTAWDSTMDPVCQDLNLTELIPLNGPSMPTTFDLSVRIDVSFQTGAGDLNFGYMNSTSWVPLNGTNILAKGATQSTVSGVDPNFSISSQLVYSIPNIQTVDLLLNNLDEGTHPFHLHGHKFWVLAQGDGDYKNTTVLDPNPIFRDTVAVRMSTSNGANAEGYGFTLIRFITDNPGAWALHCHITWHMEAGLLATFLVGGSVALQKQIDTAPAAWAALCST